MVKTDQVENGKSVQIDEEKWVYDSSVDHKGRVPFRASTGVWKASFFIIGTTFNQLTTKKNELITFIFPEHPFQTIHYLNLL